MNYAPGQPPTDEAGRAFLVLALILAALILGSIFL